MASDSYHPDKLFSIEQANAMLPLVRAITTDMVELARDIAERRHRLQAVGRDKRSRDMYGEELAQIEEELENDERRLREYVHELVNLGLEPKSAVDGLIDFPCEMDGRIVYLCWKLGEPELLYFHELADGFLGRQPLVAGSVSNE